jgi:hypothetical protein
MLGPALEHAGPAMDHDVPEPVPVLLVVIDQQRGIGIGAHVLDARQLASSYRLWLCVQGVIGSVADQDEAHGHQAGSFAS